MADSAALRARRARAHRKGDHSLCDPARRCELIEQAEAREAVASAKAREGGGYGPRGAEIRTALAEVELGPLHRLLVDEVCRIADRLDRLDAAIASKGTWLRFATDDGGTVVVTVDAVLAEARQQATTLRGLVAEIRAALPKPKPSGRSETPGRAKGSVLGGLVDELAARRNATSG